jgi:hypothetical protein
MKVKCIVYRFIAGGGGGTVDTMQPLQICIHPLEIFKISDINMLISPLKLCGTIVHRHVASVELPWLETIHFQKLMCKQDVLCNITQRFM